MRAQGEYSLSASLVWVAVMGVTLLFAASRCHRFVEHDVFGLLRSFSSFLGEEYNNANSVVSIRLMPFNTSNALTQHQEKLQTQQ